MGRLNARIAPVATVVRQFATVKNPNCRKCRWQATLRQCASCDSSPFRGNTVALERRRLATVLLREASHD